ncbi:MAG TPA: hypothetical protein VFT67_18460 [Jatrophihabitantaceae bacterium]|nr:hypothetical protein [Jatrophihabitantaceae bacterium]
MKPELGSRPRPKNATGAELVRQARAHRRSRFGISPLRPVARAAQGTGSFIGDPAVEALVGLLCLAVFAGVAAATVWGWSQSNVGTIGVYAVIVAFLTYGVAVLWRSRRRTGRPVSRTRLATVAAGSVIAVGLWLTYVVQFAA